MYEQDSGHAQEARRNLGPGHGVMSAEDTQTYERMEQEVVDLGHAIDRLERAEQMDRELNSDPANSMLTGQPERPIPAADTKRGTASDAYKKAFWNQLRGRTSYEVRNLSFMEVHHA